MANIIIRTEKPEDRSRIATLIAKTYGAEGARTIEQTGELRELKEFNSDLAIVAEVDNQVVAYSLFTPVTVGDTKNAAVLLAPFAFDTSTSIDLQSILHDSMACANKAGFDYILVHGAKGEEPAPSFENAAVYQIEADAGTSEAELLINKPSDKIVNIQGVMKTPEPIK